MLGTGTPIPDPDRSGPGVAIVVDSVAYLFDAGTGVVRRAAAAGRNGIKAFAPSNPNGQPSPRFDRVFLTHLHSDHTLGLADVIFTPWIQGRTKPLDVYGPPGTSRLVNGILDGNAEDIAERLHAFGGPGSDGWKAITHDVSEGLREVPVTTMRLFGRNWPAGGGGYFRLMPYSMSRWLLRRVNHLEGQPAIFYFHPWEIDAAQPRVPGIDAKTRFRHYVNLGRMERRLRQLLFDFEWGRVDEVILDSA